MHNVPNGHPRTANICNNITCIDVIAALENSSIIYMLSDEEFFWNNIVNNNIMWMERHASFHNCILGWYGHLMIWYKTKFNWVTWSPPKDVLPIIFY